MREDVGRRKRMARRGHTRVRSCVRVEERDDGWRGRGKDGWMGKTCFASLKRGYRCWSFLSLSLSFLTRLKKYGIARIGEANSVVLKLVAFEPRFRIGGTLYSMFLNALSKGRIGFFFSEEKETFDVWPFDEKMNACFFFFFFFSLPFSHGFAVRKGKGWNLDMRIGGSLG